MGDFKRIEINGVRIYTVPVLDRTGLVKTGFSTRFGGVSEGRFESLNFSFITGDKRENVVKNYRRYANALDINTKSMVLTKQIHKDIIHIAAKEDFGGMVERECELPHADALVTNMKNVTLVKFSADCPIIYLLDTKKKAVGLIHSGWRSTELNIVAKTINKMEKEYGCKPENMLSAIGPSIESCCFEVGEEVAEIFTEGYGEGVIERGYKKPHVDLKKVLTMQLLSSGIKRSHIAYSDICTGCNIDEFHSYRITKGECGLSIGTITLI